MAESDRTRARRVLAALRSLPPGVLESAAEAAPADVAARIAAMQRALIADDPEAAIGAALRDVANDSEVPRAALAGAARLADDVGPLQDALRVVSAGRAELAARTLEAREAYAGDDPDLVALIDRTLDALGEDGPFAALATAARALAAVRLSLEALARGDVDPQAFAAQAQRLRALRTTVTREAGASAGIGALLEQARAYAERRGDRVALARLALARAALDGATGAWDQAFDLAAAADAADVARDAARRLAAAALDAGDLARVAQIAGDLVALAARAGDADTELAALGDEALALVQLRRDDPRSGELVARVHALAGDHPVRRGRASLLEGQVSELRGDEAGARRAFRRVMELARDHDGLGHELGWAALHLGRLEASAGQPFRAAQDLELAQQVGEAARDPALIALALGARIELAPDRAAAQRLIEGASGVSPQTREELARRIATRWPAASS